ncbi:MAG: hypothetical protein WC665_12085 [Sulfurimonas sp.]
MEIEHLSDEAVEELLEAEHWMVWYMEIVIYFVTPVFFATIFVII